MSHIEAMLRADSRDYDIIIIGGGPAGCATALSIARRTSKEPVRVLLIDDADPHAYKIGESLPAAARRPLSMLDPLLLPRVTEDTLRGLHDMCTGNASAWASAELHETYSLMNPYGAGWHLDRALFDETLREACGTMLLKGKFVAVRRTDIVAGNVSHGFGWEVDVRLANSDKEETFRAKWVVDATGRKASVARKIGARTCKHSDLLSFYLIFEQVDADWAGGDDDTRTLIEAAPNGWWYSARLPHRKRLVMYTTSPSNPTARLARSVAGFLDLIHSDTVHVRSSLHSTPTQDMLSTEVNATMQPEFPLYEPPPGTKFTRCTTAASSTLEPCSSWESPQSGDEPESEDHRGRGWCAVGDAALAFDPLSSQGIITALNAGAFLGSVLARHLRPSADGGALLGGGDAADGIRRAYEDVREKYEEGRAYYYRIVKRFKVTGGKSEDNNQGFWEGQR